jgi:hypothetical protein
VARVARPEEGEVLQKEVIYCFTIHIGDRRGGGARASARREHVGAVLNTYSRDPGDPRGPVLTEAVAVARRSWYLALPGLDAGAARDRTASTSPALLHSSSGNRGRAKTSRCALCDLILPILPNI